MRLKIDLMKARNKIVSVFVLALATVSQLSAQFSEGSQPNLVPNASFEDFAGFPIGWYYKGADFDNVMQYWSSPTTASPDAYGPRVRVPASWSEKGFGHQAPRTGRGMAGITVFGCEMGKPHCREYVQIQLTEPLVIGQSYIVDFWVSHLAKSLKVNNLGAYFSQKKMHEVNESKLGVVPQVKAEEVLDAEGGRWVHFSGKFTAYTDAKWLIIGNFFADEQTVKITPSVSDPLNFAYYYIDDVSVKKTEPVLNVPVPENDLTRIKIEVGKIIRLNDIYFESDRAELMPQSNTELNKLLRVMNENPTLEIEIVGHTDNVGNAEYNTILSKKRAAQVAEYLVRNGVRSGRIRHNGLGSFQPFAANDSEESRQLNRRVEFRILKK
jgi:OmpA-OmpF porin, OOP family